MIRGRRGGKPKPKEFAMLKKIYRDFRELPAEEHHLALKLAIIATILVLVIVRCYYLTLPMNG
jgi:hypothetical protein